MRHDSWLCSEAKFSVCKFFAAIFVVSLLSSAGWAQTRKDEAGAIVSNELNKYPGLLEEFGRLVERIQREAQLPEPRNHSELLEKLPASTIVYAAFPNYGEASRQSLAIFRDELTKSAVLRNWWHSATVAKDGPQLESYLEKFSQISEYLGDEIVLSGIRRDEKDPFPILMARVRKPGLKELLLRMATDLAFDSKTPFRVLDVNGLAIAKDTLPAAKFVVLVSPELLIVGPDVATLRAFHAQLRDSGPKLAATAFGERMSQPYVTGATILGGVDLQSILSKIAQPGAPTQLILERTGFDAAKFLIWEQKRLAGVSGGQMELSFTGPRRGVASWLARPGKMGSLDFVSPHAVMAGSVLLKDPSEIYEDVKGFATASNPNAWATVEMMEAGLRINLKNDIFRSLSGEVAFELDDPLQPEPSWKAFVGVKDPQRLQAAFGALLANAQLPEQRSEDSGLVYHTLQIPSAKKTSQITYTISEGYLILAPNREAVHEAVMIHKSSDSLGRSRAFVDALAVDGHNDASGILYQDAATMMARNMQRLFPNMAQAFQDASAKAQPAISAAYGEESAIRTISRTKGMDAGAVLVVAAIAIPNLLRARIAANEASAASTIRTANTAQMSYAASYPSRGFARNLARLGPDPSDVHRYSPEHAGLVDVALGGPTCTGINWCEKSGYQFRMTAVCTATKCDEYVVVGIPLSSNAGARNFCSTSDGVVRFKVEPLPTKSVSASECGKWQPL
ncbi:MAG TPA: hypothetical protein VHR84_13510 [Terriglobales bacterium]|jgi:hypothetical protein|nr:hypothetical protein [Terriglobales bacterium]